MKKLHRYPGITPFSKEQKNIFFGRDRDIQNLKNLILVRNQVLLYAKSGVGKTSLLNAGVLPIITDKYTPILIRFTAYTQDSKITPIQNVINKISSKINTNSTIIDELVSNKKYPSLWFYLKQIQLQKNEKPFIFVFDQFEELFTYPSKQVKEFKEQLSQIIKTETPDEIFELISHKPELEDHQAIDDLYEEVKVKIVYAIRSDKLSLLNKLSDKISNIQRDYYELKPLTDIQAKQAILNPAKATNQNFITNTFKYDEQAVLKIISTLSDKDNQNIETTQLQIVCQRIEEIVLEKQNNTLQKDSVLITSTDLPEFKDIFFSFYENATSQTSEKEKTHIFIEDQLIRNGQRISLDERICKDYVSANTLKILTYSHLLRSEPNSTGGFNYELSHDTLVEPILISREKRIIIEEGIKLKEKEEQKRRRLLKERKRQRKIIYIISIASIISIGFGVFGFQQMLKANKTLENLQRTQYKNNFEKGKKFKDEYHYDLAIKQFEIALEFKDNQEAKDQIKDCKLKISKESNFIKLFNEAEQLFKKNEWEKSLHKYLKANKLGYKDIDKIISDKKKTILNILDKDLKEYELMPDSKNQIRITKTTIETIKKIY